MTEGAPTPAEVRSALAAILQGSHLLTLATVSPDGGAHASIAFFDVSEGLRLRTISPVGTEHGRNLAANPSAAVTVFDSRQDAAARRGAQLFGRIVALEGEEANDALRRFAARLESAGRAPHPSPSHRVYEFVPVRAKVFDEVSLVEGRYLEIAIH